MARKPRKPKLPNLTAPERDVLLVLTEGRKTTGPVRIASDLYQRGHHKGFTFGDPVGLVTWLLEGLAEKGLVVYSEPGVVDHAPEGYHGLPFNVRLTQLGWEVAGYPHVHVETGTPSRHKREVSPWNLTDYRAHGMTAVGSEVERLPWREHRAKYPEHTHGYDIFIQQEDDTNMATRSYVRVTPDMEERVVASYARLGDYAKVAQETNVTERQVRYIVKDRPVLGRSTGSLKQQALLLIRERGPYADIMGLHADLPGPHGLHNLVHILHSLHKAALIDFREASGKNGVTYLNIHARPVSVDALLMSEQSDTQAVTEEEPTVAVAPTNGADGPTYPELARLLSEQKQWLEAQGKAGQYMLAAELLQDTDPETAELLLTKAADIEHVGLSPVEREYLTYAEAHSDDPTG